MSAAVYAYLSNVQIAIIGETEPDVTKVIFLMFSRREIIKNEAENSDI